MNIFNQLKNKFFGSKKNIGNKNSNPLVKFIAAKMKLVLISAGASIASFLAPVIIILAVVAFFIGFVQANVDRVENLLRGGCLFCSNEELEKMKEDQFYTKIRIIKEVGGQKINDVVLASTILFQGQYADMMDSLYDETFTESDFKEDVKNFFNGLGVTGSSEYTGISQEQINLLDAATIIMVNSNVDGKYDEESYKKALASPGYGSDNFLVNGMTCINEGVGSVINAHINLIPGMSIIRGDGNSADDIVYLFNTVDICNEGFIGGTISEVKKITNPEVKQRKKEQIAQEIIDFSKFYESLFSETDPCLYYGGSVGTGDIVNWRQCDSRWANISIGSSTVCRIGCTTTAISYIIAKSGTKLAVPEINPGVYASEKSGYDGALINWNFSKIAPKMKSYAGSGITKSNYVEKISSIINTPIDGKQAFVLVEATGGGGTHWVAVDHVENGTVYVLDPSASQEGLTDITTMHRWSTGGPSSYRVLYADDVPFGATGSSSSSTTNTSIDVTSSAYQERLEKSKKYYQASAEMKDVIIAGGSKMGSAGCIISSLMGMYYLYTGNEIDVERFIKDIVTEGEWKINGAGYSSPYFDSDESSPLLTQNWGLSGHPIATDLDSIKETLRKGKKIMVNIGPNSGPYPTSYGHYLVFDHINPDTGEIYVWDPVGSTSRNGYKTDSEVQTGILNVIKNGAWEFSSTMVNGSDMCETTGTASMDNLLEMLKRLEGEPPACTVRGKVGYETYIDSMDQSYAGTTTAYGITQVYNRDLADSIGYTNFDSDMSNGCVEKDYIDEMGKLSMEAAVENVKADYEAQSGGKQLEEYQYHSLALIYHHWPVGVHKLIGQLVKLDDVRSYEAYHWYLTYNGLGGAQGALNRREVEYHLLYNGNYDADRVYDVVDTKEYWAKRVEIYKSEQVS